MSEGLFCLLAPDMKQAKVLLDYAEGTLESTPIMRQLILSRTAETLTLKTGITLEVRICKLPPHPRRHLRCGVGG